jgi:hypothetical protein
MGELAIQWSFHTQFGGGVVVPIDAREYCDDLDDAWECSA